MSDEILQDDAPPQSLYLMVLGISFAVTFVIGVVYW
mgnify:CR=1 FL=1